MTGAVRVSTSLALGRASLAFTTDAGTGAPRSCAEGTELAAALAVAAGTEAAAEPSEAAVTAGV